MANLEILEILRKELNTTVGHYHDRLSHSRGGLMGPNGEVEKHDPELQEYCEYACLAYGTALQLVDHLIRINSK